MLQLRKMTFSKFSKLQMFLSTQSYLMFQQFHCQQTSLPDLLAFHQSQLICETFNLMKLRSVVLRTEVIDKLSLEWPQSPFLLASAEIFQGGNVDILLILSRLLTIQCKQTFTKRFTHSMQKEITPFYSNNHKKRTSLAVIARYIAGS